MEKHPDILAGEGVVRKNGEVTPFNAGDAIAVVCDVYGLPIPLQIKARLGRSAKELLESGFSPKIVCAALLVAVKRVRPDLASHFAMEIQNAAAGQSMSWSEYQRELWAFERASQQSVVYQALKGAFG